MKVVHIEARMRSETELPKEFVEDLPEKVAVFTTIQMMNSLEGIMDTIEESGREPVVFKTGHTRHKGQILGYNVQEWQDYSDEDFDAFVYVGDGLFHPKALLWKNPDKKVYGYNPFNDTTYILTDEEVAHVRKKYKAALSLFHKEDDIGVLVSTKPGQFFLQKSLELQDEYPDKNFHYLIDNTVDFFNLEDFNFVDVWVNTACPRIAFDDSIKIEKPVVNLEDVKKEDSRRALIQ